MQKFLAIGRVGKEVETRRLENGTVCSKTTLAVSKKWKDKDGNKQESTTWVNLIFWRGLAEVVEKYVKKGDQIYIEGEMQNREYEKDGVKKYFTEIVCSEMEMLGGKKDNSTQHPAESPSQATPVGGTEGNGGSNETTSDDLPF